MNGIEKNKCMRYVLLPFEGWSCRLTITSSLQRFAVELNGQGNPPAKSIHGGFNDLVPHATASPPRSTRGFFFLKATSDTFQKF